MPIIPPTTHPRLNIPTTTHSHQATPSTSAPSPCLPPLQCRTLTQFGNCSGETPPKGGPLRSGSYCGAALHRWYLMVLASAQIGARPERKDGGHPDLCNATPQWLHQRHQSHQSHLALCNATPQWLHQAETPKSPKITAPVRLTPHHHTAWILHTTRR